MLCDTGGLWEITPAVRRFCRFFVRFFDAGARRAWWYKTAFTAYYRIVLPSRAAVAQRKRIVHAAFEIAPLLRDAFREFAAPEADIRPIARQLQIPVWIAWAKSDRVIPLRYALPLIAELKQARLTRFSGGHAAFLERPKQFAREFLKFARSLEAESKFCYSDATRVTKYYMAFGRVIAQRTTAYCRTASGDGSGNSVIGWSGKLILRFRRHTMIAFCSTA